MGAGEWAGEAGPWMPSSEPAIATPLDTCHCQSIPIHERFGHKKLPSVAAVGEQLGPQRGPAPGARDPLCLFLPTMPQPQHTVSPVTPPWHPCPALGPPTGLHEGTRAKALSSLLLSIAAVMSVHPLQSLAHTRNSVTGPS